MDTRTEAATRIDLLRIRPDLAVPAVTDTRPGPGARVREPLPGFEGTAVRHLLYLPVDWAPGRRYPVIFEYPGNGPYTNEFGDHSSGEVEACMLGYGLTAGAGFIWVSLPFVDATRSRHERQWWGDLDATLRYAKDAVRHVCARHGGDPTALFIAGFSRGAIACNFIGLHDDEIAPLWRGFFCHSHYDGVKPWPYAGSDRPAAAGRLARLRGRPQFISHELTTAPTRAFLAEAGARAPFTFVDLPFPNHRADWILRDIPARAAAREWLNSTRLSG